MGSRRALALLLGSALFFQAAPSCGPAPIPWYFALHGVEVGYDLDTTDDAFAQAVALGAAGVRTDVFWYDVEPERDVWDEGKLLFYTSFVSKALAWGLDPMMILSGAPGWAIDLYEQDPAAFFAEYEAYVTEVVLWIGDRTTRYQLWNEANHLIDPIDASDDWQLFARAGAIVRALDPGAILFVNVYSDLLGWEAAVTGWVEQAGDAIDVIGIDHYPGTWACCSYTDWAPLDVLAARINDPGDAWFGKQGAVLETGFSSWAWAVADEEDQRTWINESLPVVRQKMRANNQSQPNPIVLGVYYQLIDVDTGGVGPEAHFGVLHSDLSPKLGTSDLGAQIALF